jgi:hypothetical protein
LATAGHCARGVQLPRHAAGTDVAAPQLAQRHEVLLGVVELTEDRAQP